jgi:hypothetical protein
MRDTKVVPPPALAVTESYVERYPAGSKLILKSGLARLIVRKLVTVGPPPKALMLKVLIPTLKVAVRDSVEGSPGVTAVVLSEGKFILDIVTESVVWVVKPGKIVTVLVS